MSFPHRPSGCRGDCTRTETRNVPVSKTRFKSLTPFHGRRGIRLLGFHLGGKYPVYLEVSLYPEPKWRNKIRCRRVVDLVEFETQLLVYDRSRAIAQHRFVYFGSLAYRDQPIAYGSLNMHDKVRYLALFNYARFASKYRVHGSPDHLQ